ncbi:MAG TPA: hypothetical protein VHH36_01475 [Candidatus Thermoplasmatota archaeon]|nr:hypothetical protein [Candidatus Thermoplasmatota archaeon]
MRTILLSAALLLAALALPSVDARPQCLQVYPWSELCEGDVEGFQEAVVDDDACVRGPDGTVTCRDLTACFTRAGCDLLP